MFKGFRNCVLAIEKNCKYDKIFTLGVLCVLQYNTVCTLVKNIIFWNICSSDPVTRKTIFYA